MFARILLLFVLIPLLELVILIGLGSRLGFLPTVAIVLATGVLGTFLMRSQGGRIMREIRSELHAGRVPAAHLLDGLLILIGGLSLLTPGLISDLFGLALLFPPTRAEIRQWLRARFEWMVRSGNVSFTMLLR